MENGLIRNLTELYIESALPALILHNFVQRESVCIAQPLTRRNQ